MSPPNEVAAGQPPQFAPIRSLDMTGNPQMGTGPRNSFISQSEPIGGGLGEPRCIR